MDLLSALSLEARFSSMVRTPKTELKRTSSAGFSSFSAAVDIDIWGRGGDQSVNQSVSVDSRSV